MQDTVVLVNFLPSPDSTYKNAGAIYPSTGILLIASYLSKNGYNVSIIDGAYHENYKEMLIKAIQEMGKRIIYVGMSVMVTQIPFALEAAKMVKKESIDIPVVWGGAHVTLYPEATLRDRHVDFVIINEGTNAALKLAETLVKKDDLGSIKGVGYKDLEGAIHITAPAGLDNLSTLPFFDFSLFEPENYLSPKTASVYKREFPDFKGEIRIMPILTGLGCPYRCQFCINVILKRRYRYRSARSIVDEIKRLKQEYRANTFLFLDEDFFINKKRIIDLVRICEAENLHFNFRAWCRVDHFKESYLNIELLKRLSEIGCFSLAMGGESASSEILVDLKKGITPEQIMNSLKVITAANKKRIFPRYSFIVGLENESMRQMQNTYRFCMEMKKINPSVDIAGPFIFRLYPGSPIFNRLVSKYQIKFPDSLESWNDYITGIGSFQKMPWTPIFFQKHKDVIEYYANHALKSPISMTFNLKAILSFVLRYLSQFRLRCFQFFFPAEYWAFSLFNVFYKRRI